MLLLAEGEGEDISVGLISCASDCITDLRYHLNVASFYLPLLLSSDFVMGMDLRVRQAGAALVGLVPELAVPGTRISDVVQVWEGVVCMKGLIGEGRCGSNRKVTALHVAPSINYFLPTQTGAECPANPHIVTLPLCRPRSTWDE